MDYYEKRMLEIGEMTSTPIKREGLNGLSNSEKLAMLYELTESKDLLSTKLFSTKKHCYTVGDMITLFSFMILLCSFVYISLIIGIK